jgi:hypothetical protein
MWHGCNKRELVGRPIIVWVGRGRLRSCRFNACDSYAWITNNSLIRKQLSIRGSYIGGPSVTPVRGAEYLKLREGPPGHSLLAGGNTSEVVEPATGEFVRGLALARAAKSAIGTRRKDCILTILVSAYFFNI